MKRLSCIIAAFILVVILTSCASNSQPAEISKVEESEIPVAETPIVLSEDELAKQLLNNTWYGESYDVGEDTTSYRTEEVSFNEDGSFTIKHGGYMIVYGETYPEDATETFHWKLQISNETAVINITDDDFIPKWFLEIDNNGDIISITQKDKFGGENYPTLVHVEDFKEADTYTHESFNGNVKRSKGLELVLGSDSGTVSTGGFIEIKGQVKNNSSINYSYVEINFDVYDSSGNKASVAMDNIKGLNAGETWSFNAIGHGASSGATYTLSSIEGHE